MPSISRGWATYTHSGCPPLKSFPYEYQPLLTHLVCVCVFVHEPKKKNRCKTQDMDVSENRSTPKSSILIGFSIINHPFYPYLPIIQKSPGQSKSGRAKHQLLDEIQVFVRSLRLRKSTKDRCDKLLPRYETPRIRMDVFFLNVFQSSRIALQWYLGFARNPN